MFWGIDIKNGVVKYDDISFLSDDFHSREHVGYLKEDMLQIKFAGDVLVDVGWHPSFEEVGRFDIVVVKEALKKVVEEFA